MNLKSLSWVCSLVMFGLLWLMEVQSVDPKKEWLSILISSLISV